MIFGVQYSESLKTSNLCVNCAAPRGCGPTAERLVGADRRAGGASLCSPASVSVPSSDPVAAASISRQSALQHVFKLERFAGAVFGRDRPHFMYAYMYEYVYEYAYEYSSTRSAGTCSRAPANPHRRSAHFGPHIGLDACPEDGAVRRRDPRSALAF